jgi:hypothetical protein
MMATAPVFHAADFSSHKSNENLTPFDFTPLNRVIFGPGSVLRLGELVGELGGRRVARGRC